MFHPTFPPGGVGVPTTFPSVVQPCCWNSRQLAMIARCIQERMLVAARRSVNERWFWAELVRMATRCIQRGQYFSPSSFIFCVVCRGRIVMVSVCISVLYDGSGSVGEWVASFLGRLGGERVLSHLSHSWLGSFSCTCFWYSTSSPTTDNRTTCSSIIYGPTHTLPSPTCMNKWAWQLRVRGLATLTVIVMQV